jgi:uncharacterized protein
MKFVFVDTSYYVALLSPTDHFHREAVRLGSSLKRRIIVTEFVLMEFGNLASAGRDRGVFVDLLRQVKQDPRAMIIPASHELFERGCDLFSRRPDKEWSLTDCTSFLVMEDRSIADVLTADHHFEQAGFNVLLK